MFFPNIIVIVLDGVGVGYLPDSSDYGDWGSNTLLHIHEKVGLNLPNLSRLGLSNILPLSSPDYSIGAWGKMAEQSAGKDTTTGHWEIAGVILESPFPVYPKGFPQDLLDRFCHAAKLRGVLGNCAASGTEIIERLGDEHVNSGKPIVYTSADSVFQIAAHEEVIPWPRLYEICELAREILVGEHNVGRVIARPFLGKEGDYERTSRRRDFSLLPPQKTILEALLEQRYQTTTIGKIADIFANQGIGQSIPVKGNPACIDATIKAMRTHRQGLIFTNLVDFDSLYGHRNDPLGFKGALEYFDQRLPELYEALGKEDLLIITADHGNDPTTPSTDHSREYVPLLAYHHKMHSSIDLGVKESFADIAKTIDDNFALGKINNGRSFLWQL